MTLKLVQHENKCPDCLCMELKSIPVEQPKKRFDRIFSFLTKPNSSKQFQLLLSIQFNEQWEPLPIGRIKFGLRRGELRLRLEGSRIPLSARELGTSLMATIQTERQSQSGGEQNSAFEASIQDNKLGIKANTGDKRTEGMSDKFHFANGQISTKGDETSPAWVFEVKTGEPVLKAMLKDTLLGTLDVISHPCSVKATFQASLMEDLYVTDTQGLWSPDISKKRRAMLDRLLVKYFLKKKMGDYLSQAEFTVMALSQKTIKAEVAYDG